MRFTDLLRVGSHLAIGVGAILAGVTVAVAITDQREVVVWWCAAWWILSVVGAIAASWQGDTSRAVSRLLVDALPLRGLPEPAPVRTTFNRLWALALAVVIAVVATFAIGPQVSGIVTGLALATAVVWWVQVGAVVAVEERDGVAFYVKPTGPMRPIKLLRGPGLQRDHRVELPAERPPAGEPTVPE